MPLARDRRIETDPAAVVIRLRLIEQLMIFIARTPDRPCSDWAVTEYSRIRDVKGEARLSACRRCRPSRRRRTCRSRAALRSNSSDGTRGPTAAFALPSRCR